jgi:hypothetical protein
MSKVLFTIRPHSIIDVITNSSSELFVGKSQSKKEITELIEAAYPEYLTEYREVLSMEELTVSQLNNYFSYACSPHCWPSSKDMFPVLPGFTFDELYELGKPAWTTREQYDLRNNDPSAEKPWQSRFVTEANFEEIKNKLDPKREMYFLYSSDENPDWHMQEKLEMFMERYHLG